MGAYVYVLGFHSQVKAACGRKEGDDVRKAEAMITPRGPASREEQKD
jgi:hypothetical protein